MWKRTDINYRKLSSNRKEKWRVLRRLNPDYNFKLLSPFIQLTLETSKFYRGTSKQTFSMEDLFSFSMFFFLISVNLAIVNFYCPVHDFISKVSRKKPT